MKNEHLQMLNQAKTFYEQKEFDKALEHFQSLALILEGERHVPRETKAKIQEYIKLIQNPTAVVQEQLALEQGLQQEQVLASNVKKRNKMKTEANAYFSTQQFEAAANLYQQLLDIEHAVKGNALEEAHAYWNVGTSYESWAYLIGENNKEEYQKLLRKAETAIEKALSKYSKKRIKDIEECEKALLRIRKILAPAKVVDAVKESDESTSSKSITDSADQALNRAYEAIFAINAQQKPEKEQYPIALTQLNIAIQLLKTKDTYSYDDKEIYAYCVRTQESIILNMANFKRLENKPALKQEKRTIDDNLLPPKKRKNLR